METTKYIENLSPEWGHLFIEKALAAYSEAILNDPHQFKWDVYPLDEFEKIAANVKMKKDQEYEGVGFPETIQLGGNTSIVIRDEESPASEDDSFNPDWDKINSKSDNQ